MLKIEELLALLQNVKPLKNGWQARCPAHQDDSPSLHITPAVSLIMLHCFAGCSFEDICRALRINPIDLFFDDELARNPTLLDKARRQRRIEA